PYALDPYDEFVPFVVAPYTRLVLYAPAHTTLAWYESSAATAESWEDHSPLVSPHDSTAHSVHNYFDAYHGDEEADTLRLWTSGSQSGKVMTHVDTEVV
ncbi:hypothetical protein Tco_0117745, partial [Tanacetum coccineum]